MEPPKISEAAPFLSKLSLEGCPELGYRKIPIFFGASKSPSKLSRAISLAIHPRVPSHGKNCTSIAIQGLHLADPIFHGFPPLIHAVYTQCWIFWILICCRARGFNFFICCREYDSFLDFFWWNLPNISVLDILEDKSWTWNIIHHIINS